MTADTPATANAAATTRGRHVRGRSPILDVVTDLHEDVAEARFPLDLPDVAELRELRERVATQIGAHLLPRLKREAGPAVVVLGGSTGAGKSTLVNSVVGHEVTEAGVIRPTTREPVLTIAGDDAWLLADHPITELARVAEDDAVPDGLALLDAPDLDSVVESNRALGNLLLETADLWLFVTTAARYGDAIPWQVLRQAQQRGIAIAVVLNRVPREVLAEVRADLMGRMTELGLGSAPLFIIRDVGPHEGPLPPATIAPLRDWLALLGSRNTARGVVRRSTAGVWSGLREELLQLADGISAQAMAAGGLRSAAERAAAEVAARFTGQLGRGAASLGAPTTRWLAAASSGGPLAPLTGDVSRVRRGWRGSGLRARNEAATAIGADSRQALAALLRDARAEAATAVQESWRRPALGAQGLLEGIAPTDDASRDDEAASTVATWAQRTDETAQEALRAAPPHVAKVVEAAGLSALLQAAATGLDGAGRATRALLPDGDSLARVRADLMGTMDAAVQEEARPYLTALDALSLRSEAGAGLRLRASELKEHR